MNDKNGFELNMTNIYNIYNVPGTALDTRGIKINEIWILPSSHLEFNNRDKQTNSNCKNESLDKCQRLHWLKKAKHSIGSMNVWGKMVFKRWKCSLGWYGKVKPTKEEEVNEKKHK